MGIVILSGVLALHSSNENVIWESVALLPMGNLNEQNANDVKIFRTISRSLQIFLDLHQ